MNNDFNEIDNFFEQKFEEIQNQNLVVEEPKTKKSRKGIIVAIVALLLAGAAAITAFMGFGKKKKNVPEDLIPETTITMSVDDLGKEEEIPETEDNKIYGEITGDIKKEDLVEKDGTIWKDQEAADKSEDIGKVEIDLQDGKLEKDEDGDVVIKDEKDYVVKDEEGNEKETGTNENGIPDGYSWDSVLNKYVKTEDVGKYVYVDATYYGPDGEVVYNKGEIVLKETLEKIKQHLSTTKPIIPETTSAPETTKAPETTSAPETTKAPETTSAPETTKEPEPTTQPTEEPTKEIDYGTINADGTFTIAGVTFADKETYDRIVAGDYEEEDLRYNENGAIYIKSKSKTR